MSPKRGVGEKHYLKTFFLHLTNRLSEIRTHSALNRL